MDELLGRKKRIMNMKMNEKYEFSVGDYVETTGGYIGKIVYISTTDPYYIFIYFKDCYQKEWRYTKEELKKDIQDKRFKRIGKYVFNTEQEESKKIEKLEYEKVIEAKDRYGAVLKHIWFDTDAKDIIDKLNEVIDRVNEIGEKE